MNKLVLSAAKVVRWRGGSFVCFAYVLVYPEGWKNLPNLDTDHHCLADRPTVVLHHHERILLDTTKHRVLVPVDLHLCAGQHSE